MFWIKLQQSRIEMAIEAKLKITIIRIFWNKLFKEVGYKHKPGPENLQIVNYVTLNGRKTKGDYVNILRIQQLKL